ncbi:GNAT family N-acetyltransferase [Candidatus Kaiserbacteria bacterium]|nr:GNAT family N-acetyltransferase [Candidatus Kaiserbacteria bacterium]
MIKYRFASDEETEFTDTDVRDVNSLLKQLSRHAHLRNRADLRSVAAHSRLLLALHEQPEHYREVIIGIATLVPIRIPIGNSGRIEDVVVSEDFRGKGIGHKLTQRLIQEAQAMGLRHIDLTSSPRRVAANKLYQSLGFEQWETNVYRLNLKPEDSR